MIWFALIRRAKINAACMSRRLRRPLLRVTDDTALYSTPSWTMSITLRSLSPVRTATEHQKHAACDYIVPAIQRTCVRIKYLLLSSPELNHLPVWPPVFFVGGPGGRMICLILSLSLSLVSAKAKSNGKKVKERRDPCFIYPSRKEIPFFQRIFILFSLYTPGISSSVEQRIVVLCFWGPV